MIIVDSISTNIDRPMMKILIQNLLIVFLLFKQNVVYRKREIWLIITSKKYDSECRGVNLKEIYL